MPKPWSSDSPLSAPTEDTLLLKEFRREQVGADEMVYCYVNPKFIQRIRSDNERGILAFSKFLGDQKDQKLKYNYQDYGVKNFKRDILNIKRGLKQFYRDIGVKNCMHNLDFLKVDKNEQELSFNEYNFDLMNHFSNYAQTDAEDLIATIFFYGVTHIIAALAMESEIKFSNSLFDSNKRINFSVFPNKIYTQDDGCCFYAISLGLEYITVSYLDYNEEKRGPLVDYFLEPGRKSYFTMTICTKHFFDYVNNFDFTEKSIVSLCNERVVSIERQDFYSAAKSVSLLREFINEDKSAEIGSTSDFEANRNVKGILDPLKEKSDLRQNLDLSLYHAYRAIESISISSKDEQIPKGAYVFRNKFESYPYYRTCSDNMGALRDAHGSLSIDKNGFFQINGNYNKDTNGEELYQREGKSQLEYIKQKKSLLL